MNTRRFLLGNMIFALIIALLGFFSWYSYHRIVEMLSPERVKHIHIAGYTFIAPIISFSVSLILLVFVVVGYFILKRRNREHRLIAMALLNLDKKLIESEEKFNRLFFASPAGIVLTSYDGKYAEVNDSFIEMTGYARTELIGHSSEELGLSADPAFGETLWKELKEKGVVRDVEMKIRNKSGRIVDILSSIETVTLQGQKFFLNVHHDITQRKKAEEMIIQVSAELELKNKELEKSNKELESFSYIASHDLQEPLRKIQTFVGKILESDESLTSERNKDYFKRVLSATSRMQTLINALFSYSHLRKEDTKFSTTNLSDIVEEVKKNLFDVIEEKKAVISTKDLPVLHIEPLQFYQLFSNLIDNSIKYSRKDVAPVIKISGRLLENCQSHRGAPRNYWEIRVTDNGIGFDPVYSQRIFELFGRLHGRVEYPGTGIGLAICKKVVENHNGMIMADGAPGEGSTFHIIIPQTHTHE